MATVASDALIFGYGIQRNEYRLAIACFLYAEAMVVSDKDLASAPLLSYKSEDSPMYVPCTSGSDR